MQTWCLLSNAPPEMMSLLTPRGSMRRSTFFEEDLGKVVDLCEHGTWANEDLCEIIQELVDALSPLQTTSKGHKERFVALEDVQKTAQEQASCERRGPQSKRGNLQSRCLKMHRKNLNIRCLTVPNVRAGSTLLFWATTNLNGLQLCLGSFRL